jgi:hypothetical protein
MNITFLSRISFVITIKKRDIKKLFILPSSWNISNFDYYDKIYQHLPLPSKQKPRHLSLPLKLSSLRVIPSNTLERHSIGSCVEDGVHNLVTNFSMAKLVGSITSDFTFTY